MEMGNPFFVKSFFFRFLDGKQIAAEFEKEIQSIEETLGDLKNLKETVESRADEHGQFIYRTTILLCETMRKACSAELSRIKRHAFEPEIKTGGRFFSLFVCFLLKMPISYVK